jgi:hypothetical protein
MVAVVYHPPGADKTSLRDHLFESRKGAESAYAKRNFVENGSQLYSGLTQISKQSSQLINLSSCLET